MLDFCSSLNFFFSTVGFNNKDDCCQLQEFEKLIKEMLLKGILTLDFGKFITNNCEQTMLCQCDFFLLFIFFSQNHARNLGVQFIYEYNLYTSFYGRQDLCQQS